MGEVDDIDHADEDTIDNVDMSEEDKCLGHIDTTLRGIMTRQRGNAKRRCVKRRHKEETQSQAGMFIQILS